jgi:TonB-dependent starch-binding outer membrane protein SusC
MRSFRVMSTMLLLLAQAAPAAAQSLLLYQPASPPGIRALDRPAPTSLRIPGLPAPTPRLRVGTITGIVRDAKTLAPVGAVQVHIPNLALGVLAQANGRFVLPNVPAGTHTIRAERIGFRPAVAEVTVVDNQTVEVNLDISEDVLSLDAIVATGTAGAARRREVGNTMSQIDVAQVAEPVSSIDNLLQGRAPSLYVSGGSGGSGNGARIRLRGLVSMSMSNQPLIYVDGLRIKSEPYPAGPSGPQDRQSPINDINPADVERVEIIKGAAATTLYGTEAAAGVIQIFTKRGSNASGRPTWTAQMDQGFNYIRPWGPDLDQCVMGGRWPVQAGAQVINCKYMFQDPILRNGHLQRYSLSVGGGQQDLRYFLSFAMDDSQGGIETDWEKRLSLRGNASFRPNQKMLIDFSSAVTSQDVQNTRQGNTGTSTVMVANQEYWGPTSRTEEALREMLRRTSKRDLNRFITGVTMQYEPIPSLTNKVTVGLDIADWRGSHELPYGWRFPEELGQMTREVSQTITSSVDYTSSLRTQLTTELRSTFSFGAQFVDSREEVIDAIGRDFPGPGEYTVTSTARHDSQQSLLRVVTGGFFVQGLFDFRDRYFLTVGLRVDGNSSFGQDFGLQPYPKVSLAYVISDESFWPEGLGEMKLRTAYGHAGRAPGAFDAVRTWNPTGYGTTRSALLPGNLGNEEMGPERTQELEAGFDGAFLGGRLRADYTYYRRTTQDALFQVRPPVSGGNWGAQLENVGEIQTWGHEIQLNGTVIDVPALGLDLGLSVATNGSEVTSLGGSPRFNLGNSAWVEEGKPAPVIRGNMITNFWEKAEPIIVNDTVFGPHSPTLLISPSASFTFPGGVSLSGRAEYSGGWWLTSTQESTVMTRRLDWPACYPAYQKKADGQEAELYAWERAKCFMGLPGLYINPGDLLELRDITLSIPVTRFVPRTSQAQLTLSARNLWYWTKKELMVGHPEANAQSGQGISQITRNIAEQLPPSSSFVVAFRVVF